MKNFKLLIISLLMAGSSAFAINEVDKSIVGSTNILFNPGFESGKVGWAASGGTLAIATSGSNLLTGSASATWDSTSATQTLTSKYVTIPNGLKGVNGEFGCNVMTPSGTTTSVIQVYNGSSVVSGGSLAISSSSNPTRNFGIIPIPTSGSLAIRVLSVASDEPSITIDDCYLGPSRSIGAVQVITEWKACSNTGAGTLWTSVSGGNPAYGTIQNNNCFWRRVGQDAEVAYDYRQSTAGTNPAAMALFNLTAVDSSLVIDTAKLPVNSNTVVGTYDETNSTAGHGVSVTSAGYIHNLYAVPYTSTQLKFDMSYTGPGQGGLILGNTSSAWDQTKFGISFKLKFPVLGWTATSNAVRTDQTDFPLTNYGTISISAVTTAPTKGATAIDKVEVERKGQFAYIYYTYQQTGAGSAGTGAYLLGIPGGFTIDTAITGTTSTASNTTSSLEASRVVGEGYIGLNSSSNGPIHCYVYNSTKLACTAYASLTTIDYLGSALYAFNNTTPSFRITVKVPIVGWTETQSAPVMVGGVTNGGQAALRLESASVTAAGVVTELNGSDWINGNCSLSTSTFTCLFNSGIFTVAPQCQLTLYDTGAGDEKITVATTGSVVVALTNPGVGNIAYPFNLLCLGQR